MEHLDDMDLYFLDELLNTSETFQLEVENVALHAELKRLDVQLEEAKLEISRLKRRLDGCETAILWCGEACWDELAQQPNSGWVPNVGPRPKRRRVQHSEDSDGFSTDGEQTVIDLTKDE